MIPLLHLKTTDKDEVHSEQYCENPKDVKKGATYSRRNKG